MTGEIDMLFSDVLQSCIRWVAGLTCGTVFAVSMFIFHTLLSKYSSLIQTIFNFCRSIPVIALVPLFIYIYGSSELGKYVLIAWATSFPILISLIKMARLDQSQTIFIKATRMKMLDTIILYRLPTFLRALDGGIKVAIGVGWISLVAAEMLGVYDRGPYSGGLAHRLIVFADNQEYGRVVFVLGIFGVLGVLSAAAYDAFVFGTHTCVRAQLVARTKCS